MKLDKVLYLITGVGSRPGEKGQSSILRKNRTDSLTSGLPLPAMEDQTMLLENALGSVRVHTNAMRRCLETPGKLMDALKCA